MFLYLVITPDGLPLFQYPMSEEDNRKYAPTHIDPVLFSGLVSALITYSIEVTGSAIGQMSFGSMSVSFSKDDYGNIHSVISDQAIPMALNKKFHLEIKSLFLLNAQRLKVQLDPELRTQTEWKFDTQLVEEIFDPFYTLWIKQLKQHKAP